MCSRDTSTSHSVPGLDRVYVLQLVFPDVFVMSSFSGVKKLLEATALPADQRCGCFQGGVFLHADSGLLQHPLFLIHHRPGRQQANSSIQEDAYTHLAVHAVQRLRKSKFAFSPVCNFRMCWEILIGDRGTTEHQLNQKFRFFIQAASSLMQHESLCPCMHCGSPAKHSSETQRATCTRLSCLFDFCTRCQEAFHGLTPCRVVQPRSHFSTSKSTPHIPGSARSKRSIRRLWPLGSQPVFDRSVCAERVYSRRQGYSRKIYLKIARSTLTLAHLLKYCWDNQPDSVIWLKLLLSMSNRKIMPKRKKTVSNFFFFYV